MAAVAVGFAPLPVLAADEPAPPGGLLSELRLGFLRHDLGLISATKEPGWDVNLEALFVSPSWLAPIWSPRPHLGASLNIEGLTSQYLYFGLTWGYDFNQNLFGELSLGGSLNNGYLDKSNPERKDLGSHAEFRESLSIGYRITPHSNLSIMLDHISNAGIAKYNGGMETVGLRFGYRF